MTAFSIHVLDFYLIEDSWIFGAQCEVSAAGLRYELSKIGISGSEVYCLLAETLSLYWEQYSK